jgi:WD40 repeat protein
VGRHEEDAIGTLVGRKDPVISVAFSPDGTCIASSSEDKTMTSRQPIHSLRECRFTRGGADAAPTGAVGNEFGHDPTTVTALSQCSGAALDKRLTIRMRKM